MEGTRTELERRMGAWHRIEIREPRGGDENLITPLSCNVCFIEIREPRGGDENLSFSVAASDVSDGLR